MKKILTSRWLKLFLIHISIGFALIGLVLLFSKRYDLMGWKNAIVFSGFMLFAGGWLSFATNEGIFDLMVYGVKSFWSGMFNKRMDKDYIQYTKDKNQVSKDIIITLLITGAIFSLIGILL